MEVCLQYRQKTDSDRAERYYKPKGDAWDNFNKEVQEAIKGGEQEKGYEAWTEILKCADENNLIKVPPNIRQPYISEDTWKKIEERDKLVAEQKPANADRIRELKKR